MSADWIVFNSKTGFKMKYFTFNSQMSGCRWFLFVLYLIKKHQFTYKNYPLC